MSTDLRARLRRVVSHVADAVCSTLACTALTVLLLAWTILVTPITWIARGAAARP